MQGKYTYSITEFGVQWRVMLNKAIITWLGLAFVGLLRSSIDVGMGAIERRDRGEKGGFRLNG